MKPALFVALSSIALLVPAGPSGAWSGSTHICTASLVRDDVVDDGAIEIREVVRAADGTVSHVRLGSVKVPEALVAAIRDCPREFHAGSCSADAYPDMYIGQSVIHPYVPGQPWRATDWARHVLRCAKEYGESGSAERKKALAFAAGWLVHYAGDAFGHTHVNHYAGGAWDWGEMDIVLKHVAYESYINTKIPGAADETLRRLDMDPVFIRDVLMMHEDVWPSLVDVSYMAALLRYHDAFAAAVEKIEDIEDDMSGGWLGDALGDVAEDFVGCVTGLDVVKEACKTQMEQASRALMEWGETSTRVIRDITEGEPIRALSAVNEWVGEWLPNLCLLIPPAAEEIASILGTPLSWITDPLKDLLEQTLTWIWEHVIRSTFERIVNPEAFMLEMHGEEVRAEVDALMGVTPAHPGLDPETFAPFHDTLVLGRLALLDGEGLAALSALLGVSIPVQGPDDNILWDCIESLDASNQLYLYPKFRLLERQDLTDRAFRRLFLTPPWEQPRSAIDPAHILLWPVNGLAFGTPVPDPPDGESRVVGYILQQAQGQGATPRVPIYAAGIPRSGVAGSWTAPVWGRWESPIEGLTFFHLAVARRVAGSADLVEDAGVGIRLLVAPGWQPPAGSPGEAGEAKEAAIAALRAQIEMLTQALASAGLPSEARAQLEARLEEMRQKLAQMESGAAGPGAGAPAGLEDPYVFPPALFTAMEAAWADLAEDGEPDASEGEVDGRPATGTVLDADGQPVGGASVTMLTRARFDQLRQTSGVPMLRLDDWMLDGSYVMGRTNSAGQYLLNFVREGEHVLIASAAGHPKTEVPVNVTHGPVFGIHLPPVNLTGTLDGVTASAAAAAAAPAAPADFGQHAATPGLFLRTDTTFVSQDVLRADGAAAVKITLRPRGALAGPVRLAVDGLPESLEATFSENPVTLAAEKVVTLSLRGTTEGPVAARLVATAGGVEKEVPLIVSLTAGTFAADVETVTVRPGGEAPLRLSFRTASGTGLGALVKLGAAPQGLSLAVRRLRPHRFAADLDLSAFTPDSLDEHREALRERLELPRPTVLRKAPIPAAALPRLPALVARGGFLLGPDGEAEVVLSAAPDATPGSHAIEIRWRRGAESGVLGVKVVVE